MARIGFYNFNEWKMSGEVVYWKELQGEFALSLRIRGVAKRPDMYSSQIMEFGCLMTQTVYDEAVRRGLRKYSKCTLSGHIESWDKGKDGERDMRVYFIADRIDKVGGFE